MSIPEVLDDEFITAEWGNAVRDAILAGNPERPYEDVTAWAGASTAYSSPLWVPGQTWIGTSAETAPSTGGRIYYSYWGTTLPFSVSQVGIEVTSQGTGVARIGLASCHDDWTLNELVRDWGTVPLNSVGLQLAYDDEAESFPSGKYAALIGRDSGNSVTLQVGWATTSVLRRGFGHHRLYATSTMPVSTSFPDPLPEPNASSSAGSLPGWPQMVYFRP